MIVSAKGRYALRIMIYLAKSSGSVVPLKAMAKAEAIPHKFIENIMTELVKAGLVESTRGKNGGYRLTRPSTEYTVAQILSVTEMPFTYVGCPNVSSAENDCVETNKNECPRAEFCPTLPMWKALDETLNKFFSQYTLESLTK